MDASNPKPDAPRDGGYLGFAHAFYDTLALTPGSAACCVQRNDLELPDLVAPPEMVERTFSCGTTVHPAELTDAPTVLYVGVGGGLEALQFAYFSRRPNAVIAVDPVARMRDVATANLAEAARLNDWFNESFVRVLDGDAFALPLPDASVDLVAQNCLFNLFEPADLRRALGEAARVLRPGGRLMMSDPIATRDIPEHLRRDDRLRAMCLSGALRYEEYTAAVAAAGFGRIEVRSRKPYRVLDSASYGLDSDLALDALDTVSVKTAAMDGCEIYSGRRAIYTGPQAQLCLEGLTLHRHRPAAISDRMAERLEQQLTGAVLLTPPTWCHAPNSNAQNIR